MDSPQDISKFERIWLHADVSGSWFDWTWSQDQIDDTDVEYVRADIAATLRTENERLRGERDNEKHLKAYWLDYTKRLDEANTKLKAELEEALLLVDIGNDRFIESAKVFAAAIEELQIELGIAEQQPTVVVDLRERIEELEGLLKRVQPHLERPCHNEYAEIETALKKT